MESDKSSLPVSIFLIHLISLFEKSAPFSSIVLTVFRATGSLPLAMLACEAIDSSLSPPGIFHGKSCQLVNLGGKGC